MSAGISRRHPISLLQAELRLSSGPLGDFSRKTISIVAAGPLRPYLDGITYGLVSQQTRALYFES